MERIDTATPDLTQENIDKIAELFPDVVTEAIGDDGELRRAVDFDALRGDLADEVVDGQRERYQFTWPGKAAAKREARTPCDKTLRPCIEESKDWDTTQNLYIEGDNLDALKLLRETYAGKVRLIYIDPPYNTGHDFIYDDDFSQSREDYEDASDEYDEEGGRLVANPESNGRFHSDWCSMMYPRLLLARDMLSSDGAIFISIDDNESMNLRKICDEVFGMSCFVGDIAWQRTYSMRNDSKGIPTEVEHIIVYSKSIGWNPKPLPRSKEMDAKYNNPDNDPLGDWQNTSAFAPGASTHQGMVYAIQHPFTGRLLYPTSNAHWRYAQDEMLRIMSGWTPYVLKDLHDEEQRAKVCGLSSHEVRPHVKAIVLADSEDVARTNARTVYDRGNWPRFFFTNGGNGGIRRKTYLANVGGMPASNSWPFSEVGHTDEAKKELQSLFDGTAPFDTPKPVRLMKRVLDIASDEDSLVLDFFSGSASMAEGVIAKNVEDGGGRHFILVQVPETAAGQYATLCDIGEERVRRAGAKIAAEVETSNRQLRIGEDPKPIPDIGFRVLKIDSSGFNDTYRNPEEFSQDALAMYVDNLKEGRTSEDLLFQVLPKFRIPLSAKIVELDLCGKRAFDVNDGQMLACFDVSVGIDTIEAIAKQKPVYAVFRDASMADDSTEANFEELFKTFSPDTIRRVI